MFSTSSPTTIQESFIDSKINLSSFKIIKQLGGGAFGKVYVVEKKDTGEIFAMKS
jgi:serum/glucocorticoid-regulated kinase 2